jgi:hypothetical protein
LERQVTTLIRHAASASGDGKGLARCAGDQSVNWLEISGFNGREIAM